MHWRNAFRVRLKLALSQNLFDSIESTVIINAASRFRQNREDVRVMFRLVTSCGRPIGLGGRKTICGPLTSLAARRFLTVLGEENKVTVDRMYA